MLNNSVYWARAVIPARLEGVAGQERLYRELPG